jgi:hypothetical protein
LGFLGRDVFGRFFGRCGGRWVSRRAARVDLGGVGVFIEGRQGIEGDLRRGEEMH